MPVTRVLIVDDSAVMRQLLTAILREDPEVEVVGSAPDPFVAWEKIQLLKPDVLTLDVEMPKMDGLTFLRKLMQIRPMPVLMVSSLTEQGCDTTLKALELGAVDYITKPKLDLKVGIEHLSHAIVEKVKTAAQAKVRPPSPVAVAGNKAHNPAARATIGAGANIRTTHQVIAVGASTGGTEALKEFLTALPADSPGIVIVQHMPEKFTKAFANRMNGICQVQVKEASDGDRILPGHVLLAPGSFHMEVTRSGASFGVRVFRGEPVNRHRPSVDVLFNSCATVLGRNAIGVIMTGMGDDGARGMLAMRQAGARTIAQNEATCVVYGMPREAVEHGGVEQILPLEEIAESVLGLARHEG